MVLFCLFMKFEITLLVTPLWSRLHIFYGAWLRCNSLEEPAPRKRIGHGITIPPRYALPYTTKNAHSTPFNCRF